MIPTSAARARCRPRRGRPDPDLTAGELVRARGASVAREHLDRHFDRDRVDREARHRVAREVLLRRRPAPAESTPLTPVPPASTRRFAVSNVAAEVDEERVVRGARPQRTPSSIRVAYTCPGRTARRSPSCAGPRSRAPRRTASRRRSRSGASSCRGSARPCSSGAGRGRDRRSRRSAAAPRARRSRGPSRRSAKPASVVNTPGSRCSVVNENRNATSSTASRSLSTWIS